MSGVEKRRYPRKLNRLWTQPLHITLRNVRRDTVARAKRVRERLQAKYLGTALTDAEFLKALRLEPASPTSFLQYIKDRTPAAFFINSEQRREIITALRQHYPDAEASIVTAADRVCTHVFDLLGSGPIALGNPIDWHQDFKSGYRWDPRQYYQDVTYASYPGGYDIKVPWELNRCQHFVWLGQAYWLTGDEKYVREFMAQVMDWTAHNPPLLGANWACAMDVAIRAVNWCWAYYFFKDSPLLADEFYTPFFKALLVHGRHIMKNLEWSETVTNNHYLSDLVGLAYLGILFPEFEEASEWRRFSLETIEEEMFKQVYPDGVDFEDSTGYHRFVSEAFLSVVRLNQLNGYHFGEAFMARLEAMLEFVLHITRPDGTVPLIGDSDNGRLHRLKVWHDTEREWLDYRYLLAIGAVLFNRADFAQAAGDDFEETFWLFGRDAIHYKGRMNNTAQRKLSLVSRGFPDAGVWIMRSSDFHVTVTAGGNGQNGIGGHKHNDALSFDLFACGHPFIIDPGTYAYTADYRERNRFRSTAYHNTIMIDGKEINQFTEENIFCMGNDSRPMVRRWVTAEDYDSLEVEHYGYERLPEPVIHRRLFYLSKIEPYLLIQDWLLGEGAHTFELFLHFHTLVTVTQDGFNLQLERESGIGLSIIIAEQVGITVSIESGWVSHSYGKRAPAAICRYRWQTALPTQFQMLIKPAQS